MVLDESSLFSAICDTQFWNDSQSWNTSSPSLTPCFVETVLVWPPAILLWLTFPYAIYDYVSSKRPPIRWNVFNISKLIMSALLTIIAIVHFSHTVNEFRLHHEESFLHVSDSHLIAVAVKTATYAVLTVYIYLQRCYGFVNSGAIWFYLLLDCIFTAVGLGSALSFRERYQTSYFVIEFAFEIVLFIFCSFPDQLPNLEEIMTSQNLYGSSEEDTKPEGKRAFCPKETASFPSKLIFLWFDKLAYVGFRRPLTLKDLWEIRFVDRSQNLFAKFNKLWKHQVFESLEKETIEKQQSENEKNGTYLRSNSTTDESRRKSPKLSLLKSLGKIYGFYFFLPSMARFFTDLLQLVNPMVLKFMIAFTTSTDEPFWHGVVFSCIFVITNVVQSLTSAYHQHRMYLLGMRVRSTLIASIYRKSLVLASHEKKKYTTGEIVNFMAVDSQRFIDMVPWICFLWTAPVQIAIALYLLYNELGLSVLGGLALMILFIPINAYVTKQVKNYQSQQMKLKDKRLKAINEMLSGIKVLKLYAWEDAFVENIEKIRKTELRLIRKAGYTSTVFVCISACSPFMVSCLTFAIYVLSSSENVLTPEKAFVSVALFNLLRIPLTMIPNMLSSLILTMVSLKRLNNFINCEETDDYVTRNSTKNEAIVVDNASFSWSSSSEADDPKKSFQNIPITLSTINLKIEKGSLTAVVGSVGSGKSSLLYALLGEMQKLSGNVNICGDLKLAYVSQQAWIQNSTVRGNILFGSPFEKKKYDKVICACALKTDFEMLTGGDQTEIGEKGINLSGGQKQRVSIARACYSDSDLYLFDDPLSAVDSHVGKHIFDHVLSASSGILKGKTRVLVTNALYMLPNVDKIVLLKDGTIAAMGTYQELIDNNSYFADLIANYTTSQEEEEKEEEEPKIVEELPAINEEVLTDPRVRSLSIMSTRERKISVKHSHSETKPKEAPEEKATGKLTEAENVGAGQISLAVYLKFFKALSIFWSLAIFINYFLVVSSTTGSNFWIADWTEHTEGTITPQDTNYRLLIYFLIGVAQILFVCTGWISIISGTMKASRTLHSRLMKSIVHAPMHFFDTTPLGRIVNRFSKDIEILDSFMQFLIRVLLNTFLQVLATLFIICYNTPIFLAFVVPFLALYYFIQRFYVSTSRQLKRLESVTRSPILNHFSETINGVTTIKAYNARARFIYESDRRVDINQRCFYPSSVANCWLQVRLELMANCLIFFASFFAAFSKQMYPDGEGLNGSETGLSLSYALNVTLSLNWFVRMCAELENNVVSVERIAEYTDVPPEAAWNCENDQRMIDDKWPDQGVIDFIDYGTRYRPGLDLVIKGIDLSIKKGEKIGIVGRTGAGKSSLTLALFRIIESAQGKIKMDNVDISKLGLHSLRSRITIIPQDPVLFCGTLRFNLDPFNKYGDEQLWNVLKLSHLESFVRSLPEGLEYPVAEAGENLSVGQRQLVCLARALLRRTNVLVLDEATAAVDLETDSLIQSTIRSEFATCTVLTIAHRLNTILDSDRVLVLDAGKVCEFDSPKSLLANDKSVFYSLAKDAGIV